MKSNPGGQLPVDEILGRDALIAELWDILARTSVVMTAERRIGNNVNDPWELGHYRSRIKSYYPKEDEVITAVLDFLATCESPATIDQVFSAVKSRETFDDRERLMEVLKLLQRDHYLDRSSDGRYSFRFPLICRWWKLDRGL
jgi:hypothetical protein